MLGNIPRTDVEDVFKKSDLHVITSMSEGNPTTLWEALSAGVPTISIDINGMKDVINKTNGFLISHTSPYKKIVDEFAQKIDQLCIDRDIIPQMKEGIKYTFDKNHWKHRESRWQEIYDKLKNIGLD
jgi:glycosyltransferase involved in cell wall biosynthesis